MTFMFIMLVGVVALAWADRVVLDGQLAKLRAERDALDVRVRAANEAIRLAPIELARYRSPSEDDAA